MLLCVVKLLIRGSKGMLVLKLNIHIMLTASVRKYKYAIA